MWTPPIAATGEWGEDEVFLLVASGVASAFAIWWLVQSMMAVPAFGRRPAVRVPLVLTIVANFAALYLVTWFWTAVEIRGGQDYTWLAMFMGGGWFFIYTRFFRWFGIDLREDVCERCNPAALWAVCGAITGGSLVYCGSICGEGPSFWNNVFTVLAAGGMWFLLWLVFELLTNISRAIAEERDVAAGARLGGLLIAEGLVFARAAAGNWESADATVADLVRDSWPAPLLMVAAAFIERIALGARHDLPRGSLLPGVLAAFLYLVAAFAWVFYLGWWEGAPV